MPAPDFIYLNVPGLLSRYSNPTAVWPDKVQALAETQLSFFEVNQLLRSDFRRPVDILALVLRLSDFTEEGKAFLMTRAVEQWLASCDRKGIVAAYRDAKGLNSRLAKFRAQRREAAN